MTRTLFSALALTLLLAPLAACDPEPVDELDAAFELDDETAVDDALDVELVDAELVDCTPPTTTEPPSETDGLDLASGAQAGPAVPAGPIWQETKWVETNLACGANPDCKIGNRPCCVIALKYVRTCTNTGCGEWVHVGSECGCG